MIYSALPIHLRKRLSLGVRDRYHRHVRELREELFQIWNVQAPVKRRDAGGLVTAKDGEVRVTRMKVDDVKRIGFLQYLRKLKSLVRLRINDARIETKSALGASDYPTVRLGITTREQCYGVTASD